MKNYFAYIVLVLVAFITYGNSIQNNYSLDDHLINDKNKLTQVGISGIPLLFTNYSFKEKKSNYSYRPVLLTSFVLEYAAFGVNPHVSHFINLILYALFCVLLLKLLSALFPEVNYLLLFFALLFFVVYPLHSELIDNIKSRDELLTNLFGLSMLLIAARYLQKRNFVKLLLIFILGLLGLLTKESIYTYFAVLPLLYVIFYWNVKGKLGSLGYVIITILLATIMMKYCKHLFLMDKTHFREVMYYENPLYYSTFWSRIPAGFGIVMYNLKLLLWPFNLSYYYGYNQVPITTFANLLTYASFLIHGGLIYIIYKFFRTNKFVLFACGLYFVNIAAVSNIPSLITGIVAERFLFIASIGLCMILGYLFYHGLKKVNWIIEKSGRQIVQLKAIIVIAIVVVAFGTKVYARNKVWMDELTLTANDVSSAPKSAKIRDMVTLQLMAKIRFETNKFKKDTMISEALNNCSTCVEIYPKYINCWNNLGILYFMNHDNNKADSCYKQALKINPNDAHVLFNIATFYELQNYIDNANHYYESAILNDADVEDLIPMYKKFVLKHNLNHESIVFINSVLQKNDDKYVLQLLLVDLYNINNDYVNMLSHLLKADLLKPSDDLKSYIKIVNQHL